MAFTLYGNTLYDWLIAASIFIIGSFMIYQIKKFAVKKISAIALRTTTYFDDILVGLLSSTQFLFIIFIAIYLSSNYLTLSARADRIVSHAAFIALLCQIGLWADKAVTLSLTEYQRRRRETDPSSLSSTATLGFIARLTLWIIVTLFVFENLGFNVTTLVASLGIGGIAIALAVQNILGDLFASLSILFDKPFMVGDAIAINDVSGTVEYIGLKTTRLRSPNGEQIVISNANLLKERISNYKRLYERRILFTLKVVYQTKKEHLRAIPVILKEIISTKPSTRFDRAHFSAYGESSLNFEVVYYITDPDYGLYMNIQQDIYLEIYERFEQENIEFAHPSYTLYPKWPKAFSGPDEIQAFAGFPPQAGKTSNEV